MSLLFTHSSSFSTTSHLFSSSLTRSSFHSFSRCTTTTTTHLLPKRSTSTLTTAVTRRTPAPTQSYSHAYTQQSQSNILTTSSTSSCQYSIPTNTLSNRSLQISSHRHSSHRRLLTPLLDTAHSHISSHSNTNSVPQLSSMQLVSLATRPSIYPSVFHAPLHTSTTTGTQSATPMDAATASVEATLTTSSNTNNHTASAAASDSAASDSLSTKEHANFVSFLQNPDGKGLFKFIKNFMWMIKAELSGVVASSAAFGYFLAGSDTFTTLQCGSILVGTMACASAAATLNQLMEIEHDRKMKRTRLRPLVTGYFTKAQAIGFSMLASSVGAGLLHWAAEGDWVAPGIGLLTIVCYCLIYTPLKRITPMNTEIGAVVGAMPVMIGWSCGVAQWSHHLTHAHGLTLPLLLETLTMPPVLYGTAFLVAWQMQHFMTIAYRNQLDYSGAGYQMMQGKDAVIKGKLWVAICFLLPLYASYFDLASPWFFLASLLPNSYLAYYYYLFDKAVKSGSSLSSRAANQCMKHGIIYFFLMAILIVLFFKDNKYHHLNEEYQIKKLIQQKEAETQIAHAQTPDHQCSEGEYCMYLKMRENYRGWNDEVQDFKLWINQLGRRWDELMGKSEVKSKETQSTGSDQKTSQSASTHQHSASCKH